MNCIRIDQNGICTHPSISDDTVRQPCIEGPCGYFEQKRLTHEELKEAAQPLLELLYRFYHPHAVIMVTQTNVEVLEGDMSVPLDLRD